MKAACVGCGGRAVPSLLRQPNRDPQTEKQLPEVRWGVCRACGLIQQSPRVAPATMRRLFAKLTDKSSGGATDRAAAKEASSRLQALKRLAPRGALVLEAGCSDGRFLDEARRAGYGVAGVEPSAPNLARSRKLMLPVRRGFLEDVKDSERYDALCAFYVLEYAFDPRRFLQAARRLLLPGGVLLLEVPDAEAIAKLPVRLTYQDVSVFTRASLARLLKQEGFAPLEAGPAGKPYGLRLAARSAAPLKALGSYALGVKQLRSAFGKELKLEARMSALLKKAAPGPVVIFGSGENGRAALAAAPRNGRNYFFTDNNAAMHGRRVDGTPVLKPSQIPGLKPALVLAASSEYGADMVRQMRALGVPPRRVVALYGGE